MKPSCHSPRSYRWPAVALWLVVLALAALLAFTACTSTVTPEIVRPSASYSGPLRNSGVYERTATGYVVDGIFRQRYNALLVTYGTDFAGPMHADDGLTLITPAATPAAERWQIDFLHFDRMLRMNIKRHSGIAPAEVRK